MADINITPILATFGALQDTRDNIAAEIDRLNRLRESIDAEMQSRVNGHDDVTDLEQRCARHDPEGDFCEICAWRED